MDTCWEVPTTDDEMIGVTVPGVEEGTTELLKLPRGGSAAAFWNNAEEATKARANVSSQGCILKFNERILSKRLEALEYHIDQPEQEVTA